MTKNDKSKTIPKLLVAAAVVAAFGASLWLWNASRSDHKNAPTASTDSAKFQQDYPKVAADNRFVASSPEEILTVLEEGSGMIFLGFPECPWCQQLAPMVDEAAKAEGLEKIHYLNIKESRTNNDDVYKRLVKKLEDYLPKDEEGNPRIYVPDVTTLKEGKVVGRFKQESPAEGEKSTPETYWTTERRERAIEQLRQMIKQTKPFADIANEVKNGAVLLDVRSSGEFRQGHFADATNLDVELIKNGSLPDVAKDTKLYVYCRSGNRSAQAVKLLQKAGFSNITDLGGIDDVRKLGGTLI